MRRAGRRALLAVVPLAVLLAGCGSEDAAKPTGTGGAGGAAGAAGAGPVLDPSLFDCTLSGIPERTSKIPSTAPPGSAAQSSAWASVSSSGSAGAASMAVSSAASATVRARGPTTSSVDDRGMVPAMLIRPSDVFNPTMPQQAAGIRMEAPVSDPNAPKHMADATAAAGPLDDPPLTWSGLWGLRVGP